MAATRLWAGTLFDNFKAKTIDIGIMLLPFYGTAVQIVSTAALVLNYGSMFTAI